MVEVVGSNPKTSSFPQPLERIFSPPQHILSDATTALSSAHPRQNSLQQPQSPRVRSCALHNPLHRILSHSMMMRGFICNGSSFHSMFASPMVTAPSTPQIEKFPHIINGGLDLPTGPALLADKGPRLPPVSVRAVTC